MFAQRAVIRLVVAVAASGGLLLTGGAAGWSVAAAQEEDAPAVDDTGETDPGGGEDQPAEGDDVPEDAEPEGEDEEVPVEEQREESLSPWWVVIAVIAGLASIAGIAISLRRRHDEEAWDQLAGNVCNAGRTVTGSLRRLDRRASPSPVPEVARNRLGRFGDQVDRLAETTPHERAERLTAVVADATRALQDAIEVQNADVAGTDGTSSWDEIDLAIAGLDAALADLERESMLGAAGASHPSGRPST